MRNQQQTDFRSALDQGWKQRKLKNGDVKITNRKTGRYNIVSSKDFRLMYFIMGINFALDSKKKGIK